MATNLLESAEWKEARSSVGRFDGYTEDLRKYGFTLITTLITASTFFVKVTDLQPPQVASIVAAITALATTLFFVDRYYTVLASGAVERAVDMEKAQIVFDAWAMLRRTPDQLAAGAPYGESKRLTELVTEKATASRIVWIVLVLYLVLEVAGFGLGIAAFGGFQKLGFANPQAVAWWRLALAVLIVVLAYVGWPEFRRRNDITSKAVSAKVFGLMGLAFAAPLATFAVLELHYPHRSVGAMFTFELLALGVTIFYFLFTERRFRTGQLKDRRFASQKQLLAEAQEMQREATTVKAVAGFGRYDDDVSTYYRKTLELRKPTYRALDIQAMSEDDLCRHVQDARKYLRDQPAVGNQPAQPATYWIFAAKNVTCETLLVDNREVALYTDLHLVDTDRRLWDRRSDAINVRVAREYVDSFLKPKNLMTEANTSNFSDDGVRKWLRAQLQGDPPRPWWRRLPILQGLR
jgi:hypothetical protein